MKLVMRAEGKQALFAAALASDIDVNLSREQDESKFTHQAIKTASLSTQ